MNSQNTLYSKINYLIDRVKSSRKGKNLSYMPRWIILLIDLIIISLAAYITYLMLDGMGRHFVRIPYLSSVIPFYIIFHLFFFWVLRTYSGIIRHSSYIDALRIFAALFLTLISLIIFNYTSSYFVNPKILMNTGLVINFIFSFCGLFIYRIIVKQAFEVYMTEGKSNELIKALIIGSDANAIAVVNALRSEKPTRFRIVGFIDKVNQNSSKRILDLPILKMHKKTSILMRKMKAEALIIADKSLSKDEKLVIIDDCLEFNYKVYTVPLISDWEDQKEISKKIKNFQIQDLLERKPIVLDNKRISDQLNNKIVLITGAAGSIGSEIVRQVIGFNPKKVILLDQAETPLHHLSLEVNQLFGKKNKIKTEIADVRDKKVLSEIFNKFRPQVVFHAAAYKHVPLMEENPAQAIFANVLGTKNLSDLSVEYGVESFVMVSTDKAVNPSNVMGASKRIAEKYVQSLHHNLKSQSQGLTTKFITTRFGNVLGSNGSVVPLFTKQIAEGGPITITHPDIIRYFMTIPEACQLVLEAGAMGKGGEIYIFDMGKPVKIIDLAKKMIRLAGFTPDNEIKIKIVGLRPGEKLYEELLNDSSKTLPTYHEKIMIAQEHDDNLEEIATAVDDLIETASSFSNNNIVLKMKAIVPEFVSMNSDYQLLDNN